MPYVLAWPEAEMKYYEYESLNLTLREHKKNIDEAATSSLSTFDYYIDSTLVGQYYDEYEAKAKEWYDEFYSISAEFRRISNELQLRIDKAIELRDTWKSRIGMQKWVKEDE